MYNQSAFSVISVFGLNFVQLPLPLIYSLVLIKIIEKKTNLMFNRLIYSRLRSLILVEKRSVTVRSNIDVGKQMKILNDEKQFEKALNLFEIYKQKNIDDNSSMIITQALKACTHIGDLQRGLTIYHRLSSSLKNDSYILASLIHLYSMFMQYICFSIFYH